MQRGLMCNLLLLLLLLLLLSVGAACRSGVVVAVVQQRRGAADRPAQTHLLVQSPTQVVLRMQEQQVQHSIGTGIDGVSVLVSVPYRVGKGVRASGAVARVRHDAPCAR